MNVSRRLRSPIGLSALALLIACAGCSSTDDRGTAAVPSPGAGVTELCRNLAERLPREVNGLKRRDPKPASPLTAGWGDPAIILRCGVARPAKMNDPAADGVTVNGVGWLLEEQTDGSFRFTTTLRKAYVEVSIPEQRTGDGVGPLTDFAAPVRKSIPEGIA
ncbi:DUF3515 domain-containing protein [Streptomyces spectabilis]|uniref:DUF3515 domain-containing protein n=1 Tax=Streptomyces spectabilis TaxID=68270 RepID=A0A5P2XIP4_STRST|nr:DUF3515 domain-containing protein [Streptomyces spectabilis]MBB5104245.1 hypothetical protein [Streptomyces spectabilis]MCI3905395.1 DUF3515 domain-containing protein [Streptomyces spectabilis]QEV62386.1 DUF3515 domain-containing protein [Streptomyces spectabilis]GGU98775.1 hypothetical protein GCM10010245_01030 [Streptomyces spectabilis]